VGGSGGGGIKDACLLVVRLLFSMFVPFLFEH
jgi:hypothetical protein